MGGPIRPHLPELRSSESMSSRLTPGSASPQLETGHTSQRPRKLAQDSGSGPSLDITIPLEIE
jgi:hypothetical protein